MTRPTWDFKLRQALAGALRQGVAPVDPGDIVNQVIAKLKPLESQRTEIIEALIRIAEISGEPDPKQREPNLKNFIKAMDRLRKQVVIP
jgi:hypothetical protein